MSIGRSHPSGITRIEREDRRAMNCGIAPIEGGTHGFRVGRVTDGVARGLDLEWLHSRSTSFGRSYKQVHFVTGSRHGRTV